jgi:carboxyl-terminal processing protease
MRKLMMAGVGLSAGLIAGAALLLPAMGATGDASSLTALKRFADALDRVHANYVSQVDDNELINSAINGMVSQLDPHSNYLDPKEFAALRSENSDDTPASKAGIVAGDFISAVNGTSVEGMTLKQVIDQMRGPPGSNVTLTVLRPAEKKRENIAMVRSVIHVQSVKSERKGDVAYIRIASFNEDTDAGVKNAVATLKQQIGASLKGYVIDLRNDPGGLLDQAIGVSDDFLTGGTIVSTRGRAAEESQRFDAKAGDIADGKPVILLINEGTASASEIVAGALQDNKRATVIGTTSYGKGSVQTIIPLGGANGGALKLTTSKYYTPSGRSIQAVGITPDVAVSNLGEKEEAEIEKTSAFGEKALAGHLSAEGTGKSAVTTIRPEEGKKYDDFQLSFALERLEKEAH